MSKPATFRLRDIILLSFAVALVVVALIWAVIISAGIGGGEQGAQGLTGHGWAAMAITLVLGSIFGCGAGWAFFYLARKQTAAEDLHQQSERH